MSTRPDIRQSDTRVLQDQLSATSTTSMDSIVASVNSELTAPGRIIAQATPSLVVSVGSGSVVNPNTSKHRSLPPISNVTPSFAGGTITFPSASGTIACSPGNSAAITIGASQFIAVLVQLDSSGNLNLVVGSAAASLAAVVVPGGSSSMLSLGYIVVNSNSSSAIQNITNSMLYQFVGGGGSGGSGSGSGTGDDLDALQFRASFNDAFAESSASAVSSINSSGTNAAYSSSKNMYVLSYDASKTATSSSTTVTMSAAPSFTVAVGDIIVSGSYQRKITAVASQTSYTIEAAFPTALAASAVCVSQAVYTKDIYNFSVDGAALSAEFAAATFSEILIDYKDNATSGSNVFTPGVGPFVSYSATNDNTNFTNVAARPTLGTTTAQSVILPSAGTSLYLRFFANQSSGSGTINLITYKAFMQKSVSTSGSSNVVWSASGVTDGSTSPINCSVAVVGGKTQITFIGYTYPMNVLPGQEQGSLSVLINGQDASRFVSGTTPSTEAYYTEVSPNVIQLDRDYSSQQISFKVIYSLQVLDSSTTNTTAINAINTHYFHNGLINGGLDIWQRGTSVTVSTGTNQYGPDRWYAAASANVSAVWTRNSGLLSGSVYGASLTYSGATAAGLSAIQIIENANTVPFQGGTVSVGVWIKAQGNTNQITLTLYSNTSESKSSLATVTSQVFTVNSANFTYCTLIGVPVTAAMYALAVGINVGTASSGNAFATGNGIVFEQAMLVPGGILPSNFLRAGSNYAAEFAACCRYYQIIQEYGAYSVSSTSITGKIQFPVLMRATPTPLQNVIAVLTNGSINVSQSAVNATNPGGNGPAHFAVSLGNFSGLTTGNFYYANPQNNGCQLMFDAEI